MKSTLVMALAAGLLSAAPAFSSAVTLDFEGTHSFGSVNNFYAGGFDIPSPSNIPASSGPNYGVSFGLDVLAMQNDGLSGTGPSGEYFSNAPGSGANPLSGTVIFAANSTNLAAANPTNATLNVAGGSGFTGGVSFYYSAAVDSTVTVYSGLNGTGTALATFNLVANDANCAGGSACNWSQASLDLGSTLARSIDLGTNPGSVLYDNLTITPVPLPAAALLLLSGLGGMGTFARKRKAA